MSKGMDKSGVPWADYRWNPIEGCSAVSEGCAHCYAATLAHRFHRPWGNPFFHESRLHQPANTKKTGRVFVCSTSDFFHDLCLPIWQDWMGLEMAKAQSLAFLILTKRPQNIRPWLNRMLSDGLWPLPNVWLGITTENQARYDERWPILAKIPAAVRFVSVEPMLGPVTLTGRDKPDWIIAGPETGAKARPCPVGPMGIDGLSNLCGWESIPFFDKRTPFVRREFPK